MKRLLTVREAAEELGITERACWQQLYRGRVPHRKLGRKVVVPVVELEAFIKALPGVTAEQAVEKAEAVVR